MNSPDAPEFVAAVDLGSNSFHMIVANIRDGHLHVVDKLREMVRLAGGLDEQRNISGEARQRALDCLARFGQRLGNMPPGSVRAVGTNTLRSARNAAAFLKEAQAALGHPIEIIAGREEARLIYLGVAQSMPGEGRRLVMDIGGGSTEFIIGEGVETLRRESLHMGCVSMSRAWFADGRIGEADMRRAELAARLELEPIENQYRRIGWGQTLGASGTIRAVRSVVEAAGWSENGIGREALLRLREALIDAGHVDRLDLPGLKAERAPVFPGGVAVLLGAFKALKIEHMQVSDGALREGLIYDLMGRIRQEDVRARTVEKIAARYRVDQEQAQRVEEFALRLLKAVASAWELKGEEYTNMLSWAARLHEVGLMVSHSNYQKHGAYLMQHSDLAGFSRQEQQVLAALVRGHRRKFPMSVFQDLPEERVTCTMRLAILLRLAVVIHRSRGKVDLPDLTLAVGKKSLALHFAPGWLDEHPLTRADLEQEAGFLKAGKFRLEFA
jgi:exopolyphosphatase/guanosine-5'-triphosphate,3'-diphosphate pyrophosphatase